MEETEATHIIEISQQHQEEEHQKQLAACLNHHPLKEISSSPGHLLLLKLWQREEDVISQRISTLETRLDNIKREAFRLCSLFFVFHFLFLTLLFSSASFDHMGCKEGRWVPSSLSLVTSVAIIVAVQIRMFGYSKLWRELQRDRSDGRALTRCVQELRMKGASFDLSKEPMVGKRMKSSSVEVKWKPLQWCRRNYVCIAMACFSGLVFPACKFFLCGQ